MFLKPENDVLDKFWIVLSFRSTNSVVDEMLSLGTSTKSEPGRQIDFGPLQAIVGMVVEGGTVVGMVVEGGTVVGMVVEGGTVVGMVVEGGTVVGMVVEGGTVGSEMIPQNYDLISGL